MDMDPSINTPMDLSFMQLWHPIMILILVLVGYIYLKLVYTKKKRSENFRVSSLKTVCFLIGLVIFYLSEGSPLKATGEYFLFSAHMLTMSLTYFVVPPLILGGIYSWMVDPLFENKGMAKIIRVLTHPAMAVSLFNLLLSFYHMPIFFDHFMSNRVEMIVANYFFFFLALVMWWPIVTPTERIKSLSNPQKLLYVFGASVILTPACALITFSSGVMYDYLEHTKQLYNFLPPLTDQKSGGVIMKVTQELAFAVTFAYIFFRWWKHEKQKPDFDNDLNPTDKYWESADVKNTQ